MKEKKPDTKKEGFQNTLTIMEPSKVRLSKAGNTVMVFINDRTVIMLSKNFLDAVMSRKYQKREA